MPTSVMFSAVVELNSDGGRTTEAVNLDEPESVGMLADDWLLLTVVKLFPFDIRVCSSI